jgi:hypothetical protein
MAEALVRVIDQVNANDPYLDCKLSKSGHVIVIYEDNHPWTMPERTHVFWRIVAIPGVSIDALADFIMTESAALAKIASDVGGPPNPLADLRTNPMLQFRGWTIDIGSLPQAYQSAVAKPRTGTGVLTVPHAAILAVKKRIAARINPNIIG